jgi:hypothetical protein
VAIHKFLEGDSMSSIKTTIGISSCFFALAILIGTTANTFGQSTDETHPTLITTLPVTGTRGSGTYYYQIPASLVTAGRANAVLNFTSPVGGASMTVTFSGPTCCPPEAYIGETTGLATRTRQGATFDIPSSQNLLVTVYISVGAGQTVPYSINFNVGSTGSGVIVTPPGPTPTPTPTPAPTPTTPPEYSLCTDLSVSGFNLEVLGATRTITGTVYNRSHGAFQSPAGQQWIEVIDISQTTSRFAKANVVQRIPFTDVPGRGSFPYRAVHTPRSSTLPPVYRVRIVYSPANRTDAVTTNDDCTPGNNTTLIRPEAKSATE